MEILRRMTIAALSDEADTQEPSSLHRRILADISEPHRFGRLAARLSHPF